MEEEYALKYFTENDFLRRKCPQCGYYYWSRGENYTCGDAPCESYAFIGNPLFKRREINEMREFFLSFFEARNHKRIDRYPIVARWRDDIFLTIASIADFQPWVTSGKTQPPANPLVISQPCIRLDDLHAIGKSGRHLTSFEMMAHHAFNTKESEIYWKEATVEYCEDLLKELGMKMDEVTYKEVLWAGGGNAGPCLEVCAGGLELATLVFMDLAYSPKGDIIIKDERYERMSSYIVDTGYGLERFVWASKGSPTVYDAIFPGVINELAGVAGIDHSLRDSEYTNILLQNARLAGSMDGPWAIKEKLAEYTGISIDKLLAMIEPVENVYAIADHARCLLLMLGDGIVPSNVKAGYLARLVMRRTLRMMRALNIKIPLSEVVLLHLDDYPEFSGDIDRIVEIIDLEEKKYTDTIEKGGRMLERISRDRKKRGGGIELEELIKLYDTHGIPPELTKEVAARMNVDVELPTDFYSKIASSHAKVEMEYDPLAERVKNLPKTRRIYYDECGDEFEAVVLDAFDDHIILDQTLFYPEGGGQPSDEGVISTPERVIRVTHVKDVDGVILHRVDEQIPRGEVILGRINLERRVALSRNHTATHVLLCAAKRVLGGHVWQSGAQKGVDRSRLDLLHYKRISGPELEEIERIANEIVMSNIIVNVSIEDRNEAERKYGFSIYQGGVPPGERIRIIRIAENVQACAGTHCKTTGEVGAIKILRCEGIQDGIERLEFAAGKAATREIQSISRKVHESADILRVPIDILPETTKKFFEEWKKQGKEIGRLKEELVKFRVDRMIGEVSVINGTKVMAKRMDLGMDELVKLAIELSKSGVVGILLGVHNGAKAVVSVPESDISKGISAVKIIKGICTILGGGGGGKEHLAQGGGPNVDKIPEAIRRGIELIE